MVHHNYKPICWRNVVNFFQYRWKSAYLPESRRLDREKTMQQLPFEIRKACSQNRKLKIRSKKCFLKQTHVTARLSIEDLQETSEVTFSREELRQWNLWNWDLRYWSTLKEKWIAFTVWWSQHTKVLTAPSDVVRWYRVDAVEAITFKLGDTRWRWYLQNKDHVWIYSSSTMVSSSPTQNRDSFDRCRVTISHRRLRGSFNLLGGTILSAGIYKTKTEFAYTNIRHWYFQRKFRHYEFGENT